MRTDGAGYSHDFLDHLVTHDLEYRVGYAVTDDIRTAITWLGQHTEAIEAYRSALEIFQDFGDPTSRPGPWPTSARSTGPAVTCPPPATHGPAPRRSSPTPTPTPTTPAPPTPPPGSPTCSTPSRSTPGLPVARAGGHASRLSGPPWPRVPRRGCLRAFSCVAGLLQGRL
ncbi:MAG: hypothetical protein V7637_1142 [Mycobacteriales bacterium]